MIRFTQTFFFFVWLSTVVLGKEFEDMSYYEKFETAVRSYKEGRYRLSENQLNVMIDSYYRARGWEQDGTIPSQKLKDMDLYTLM